MTDQKNNNSDEEYQFPQDEYVTPNSANSEQTTGAADQEKLSRKSHDSLLRHVPKIRNKRIIFVVIAVVLAIIFIRIFNDNNDHQIKPAVKTPIATPKPVIQSQPVTIQPIENLSSGSQTDTKIQALQSQIVDMQNKIDQAHIDNQQLHQTVSDLSSQLETLTQKVNQLIAALNASKKIAPQIVFHLRAIVPDRAWITSNTGATMTVTVGDPIKTYGVVKSIDAKSGVIYTSSGRKIIYGENDF